MKKTVLILLAGMFWVSGSDLAIAQEALQKPSLEPGAVFHYQSVDLLKNNNVTRVEIQTVLSVSADRAQIEIVTDNKQPGRIATLDTAHQFLLGKANTGEFEYMRFPIKVGDGWKYSFTAPDAGIQVTRSLSAKFVGWEQVTVPAGTYKAAKIEHTGSWLRSDGPYTGGLELVFWYVPEIGRFVKQSYTWYGSRGGINQQFDILLTKYQQPPDMSNPFGEPTETK